MRAGALEIHGNVGDFAAGSLPGDLDGMRGGTLIVRGDAGARFGDRMRRGTVVVHGDAGEFAASRLVAGTLALGGQAGAHAACGLRRGSLVFARGGAVPGATFVPTQGDIGVAWQLLARHLAHFRRGVLRSCRAGASCDSRATWPSTGWASGWSRRERRGARTSGDDEASRGHEGREGGDMTSNATTSTSTSTPDPADRAGGRAVPLGSPSGADAPDTGLDGDVFALLDDDDATPDDPSSRLYTSFVREHRCVDPATLAFVLRCRAGRTSRRACTASCSADYEWGAKLLRARAGAALPADDTQRGACADVRRGAPAGRGGGRRRWLAALEGREDPAPAGVLGLRADVSRESYEAAIARILEAIAAGETYQVNYTFRMRGDAWGSPVALYRRLRGRQRVRFGALARLPVSAADGDMVEWVLSLALSPELFLRHAAGRLQARPMKGTAVRAAPAEGDSETARLLHEDIKNRAENLMIVDLLRNDLGRVAQTGSVQVPELFRVEPYATVFQMTSTVEARCAPDVGLAELVRALFPCGSITGAPKHRTMAWIADLERGPRGLYTGAIGWLEDAPGCPDLVLSVAIRTLVLGPERRTPDGAPTGRRPATLGVGGGIVHDSVAADEWDEAHWKARFLTSLDPGVALFPRTIRACRAAGVLHRGRHRARAWPRSARALGFSVRRGRLRGRDRPAPWPRCRRRSRRRARTACG